MNEEEYQNLLRDAYNKWGYHSQMLIWVEEMAELIKDLVKEGRAINPSHITQKEEEIADVDICLDQMKQLFPKYIEHKKRKIERLRRLVYDT